MGILFAIGQNFIVVNGHWKPWLIKTQKRFWRKYLHNSATYFCTDGHTNSVTRFGDFSDFGLLFKAFGNNKFAQISYILRQFM